LKLKQSLFAGLPVFIFSLVFPFSCAVGDEMPSPAPVNPQFEAYLAARARLAEPAAAAAPYGTGWLPSPIAPRVHHPGDMLAPGAITDPLYDLRDPDLDGDDADSPLTPIKSQGGCGSCWAFAAYGTYESYIRNKTGVVQDYSENHLKHLHGFNWGPCAGGNIYLSSAYFARYQGPVYEVDDPDDQTATSDPCEACPPVEYIDSAVFLPVRANTGDNAYIKQAVLDHGALYTSLYWDNGYYNGGNDTYYYNYYDGENRQSNHAVVIVGWDDSKVTAAAQPGAYIVRNSWGRYWGDGGYFYASYYDESFAFSTLAYIDDTHEDIPEKIYQHDSLGKTYSVGWGDGEDWGANVFDADEDGVINAVSFYATDSMSYSVYLYDTIATNPVAFSGQLGTTRTGSVPHAGYYTVRLEEAIPVTAGDSFAVVMRFATPGYNYPIPMERPFANYSSAAEASAGESYYSNSGTSWIDVTSNYTDTNVCIKALELKLAGDIDRDGQVTLADAVGALQISAGTDPAGAVNPSADASGDGRLGVADTVYILQKLAGLR